MASVGEPGSVERGLFGPDSLLPAQYFRVRRGPLTGSQRLMAAVLEDAVAVIARRDGHRRGSRQHLVVMREAERWFRANDHRSVFSFIHVCEALDLDPGALRRAVLHGPPHPIGGGRLAARIRGSAPAAG